MRTLRGRVAVVTGAAGGLGRATAIELAGRGCHLALIDVDPEGLANSRRAVEQRGSRATVHVADVSNAERMSELPVEVIDAHGACHILVNNAGVVTIGRFAEDKLDDIRWIVGINVMGVVHGCHFFLPLLREADEAHIVNVSSMAAFVGLPQNAAYSLTKGAVRSFTEALRAELAGTDVGVSTLFPGALGTDIMDRARGAQAARVAAFGKTPMARYLRRPPEAGARQIVKAIERGRARVLVGPDARTLDVIGRVIPGRTALLGRVLDRVAGT
jgi:short-subunit dehydrogenase